MLVFAVSWEKFKDFRALVSKRIRSKQSCMRFVFIVMLLSFAFSFVLDGIDTNNNPHYFHSSAMIAPVGPAPLDALSAGLGGFLEMGLIGR